MEQRKRARATRRDGMTAAIAKKTLTDCPGMSPSASAF